MRSAVIALCVLVTPVLAAAQEAGPWDPARLHMTRDDLQELLARYEAAARSGAYSPGLKTRATYEASLIRNRLEEGDFQVGDRILIGIEGEMSLPDTISVAAGRVLTIPGIGEVPLRGVLRSELEEHLARRIATVIRDPVVRVRSLVRISVLGEVAQPGFYVVPSESLVTDVLMLAGGPTREAKLTDLRFERGQDRIWEGTALQDAVVQGRTLDQLSIRAGDRLVVPEIDRRDRMELFRTIVMIVPTLVLLISLF